MAEKRVSVRLVAEGGRQVRGELEGIGEAGAGITAQQRRPSARCERHAGWGDVPHRRHRFRRQAVGLCRGRSWRRGRKARPAGRCRATLDGRCLAIAYSEAPARIFAIRAEARARTDASSMPRAV